MSKSNSSIDKELIDRISKGDHEAFDNLYNLYRNRLYRFSFSIVKSKEKAEDICQNVFASLWYNRLSLSNVLDLSNYLYKMVRNESLNLVRSKEYEEQFQMYLINQAIDYTTNTQEEIAYNEMVTIISEALESLTVRQRVIYEMSRHQGKSHKEIAQVLGISVHTVQEHISDALKRISFVLRKYKVDYLIFVCFLVS